MSRAVKAVLLVALIASGCSATERAGQTSGEQPGGSSGPSKGGSSSSMDASANGGASGSPSDPIKDPPFGGNAGSSPAGSGGSSGTGGAGGAADLPDAGAPTGPGPDASAGDAGGGPFACAITLQALMPTRTDGVPAGEGNRFRMGATLTGNALPPKPLWHWRVTHEKGAAVPHSAVDGEPAAIEFPTVLPGVYTVMVDLIGVQGCVGAGTVTAVVPVKRGIEFFMRVTPPTGMGLAILETDVVVQNDQAVVKALEFDSQPPMGRVDPHEGADALPAFFVQISSPTSTARYEGYVDAQIARPPWFVAPLVRGNVYNVLIVPDGSAGGIMRAPMVFENLSYEAFANTNFQVDSGFAITGKVSSSTGPLPGSRLRLRDELLPSTVGTTDAAGAYSLRTRDGQFEARVVPPASSGLPEAQLPRSTGIPIPRVGGFTGTLDFTYADLPMAALALTVQKSDGAAPEKPVNVVVQTLQGQLGNVGKFTFSGQDSIPVDGVVRIVKDTGAGGTLSIEKLPRAHYRVIISPPDDLLGDSAITTIEDLDLTGAAPAITRTVPLAKRGRIVGLLAPAAKAAGLMVRVVDVAEDGVRRNTVIVPVDAAGRFEFISDPGRLYRLFVEPPGDRRIPRLTMDPVRATAGTVMFNYTLPARQSLSGIATISGKGALRGAIVQVFCRGSAPTCVDRTAADVSNTLPIDETLSGEDGRYELGLPGATP